MKDKTKARIVAYTFLLVATCSQCGYSQRLDKSADGKLRVISTVATYRRSIKNDTSKKIVLLKVFVNPLFTNYAYSTANNFTHQVLYNNPGAYARLPVALALKKVQEDLLTKGLGLKFFDTYRPYSVTKKMWQAEPDERYAANPGKGSGHNRGTAVDVTLVKIPSGQELAMPTEFDDFSEKAHHDYKNLPEEVVKNRELLKTTMEKFGFQALRTEWWHYSLANTATKYEVLDLSFDELKKLDTSQ